MTRTTARALGVAAAVAAALVVWALIEPVFGLQLRGAAYGAGVEPPDVGAVEVLLRARSEGSRAGRCWSC